MISICCFHINFIALYFLSTKIERELISSKVWKCGLLFIFLGWTTFALYSRIIFCRFWNCCEHIVLGFTLPHSLSRCAKENTRRSFG